MAGESNTEFNEKFRKRTFGFAMDVLKYLEANKGNMPWVITNQLTKSVTSIGANFRAFCRGRSSNERYAKICIVVEEADETQFWLELLKETGSANRPTLDRFLQEALEITKVTSSIKRGYER